MSAYGLLAEFPTADALLAAARDAHGQDFCVDAYAPFPVEGLAEAVGFRGSRVPAMTFIGGLFGGAATYALQWYSAVISYPINVGGRPLHSWPAFVPASLAMVILGAALAAVFGMLIANGLPRLRHPLADIPEFDLASRNRFFLCLRATPGQDTARHHDFLAQCGALRTWEVAA
jgi:hypothetical protein